MGMSFHPKALPVAAEDEDEDADADADEELDGAERAAVRCER